MQLRRILVAISVASSCGALSLSAVAPRASASSNQVSILQDDNQLQSNPGGTLANLRLLGAQVVKVTVSWDAIAPNPNSRRQPRGFHPANAAAYPPANWAIYDEIDRDAHADGMQVYLDLDGGGPRWAEGPGQPRRPSSHARMGAIPKRVRSVCACGRSAVRREVYAGRRLDPPPPRELLVGMERAQPRRFPLSTRGAWRSLGREQRSPVPQPVGGRLGWPEADRTRRGHVPYRGASATRKQALGRVPGDEATCVSASTVLRRLDLSRATGRGRVDSRVPDDRRGIETLPRPEPCSVPRVRGGRSHVDALVSPEPGGAARSELLLLSGGRTACERARSRPADIRIEDPAPGI